MADSEDESTPPSPGAVSEGDTARAPSPDGTSGDDS